ncbi:MAG: OmpH family outer membrane protein [Bacteroidales bacterium]|nr:OmpH family outer membrane protein [Bacteroidales bacterium]MDT8432769.1 OmpH family outer membrane protein [Bacteroidales bacterium]
MKNINYIIHGILGAAVIVLFVLYFTGGSADSPAQDQHSSDSVAVQGGGNIAYFKIDSVLANWELYFNVQEKLSAKQQELETDFESRSQSFMKRVEDAQYKMQRGLVTRAEAEQLQQQLAQEEQNLAGLQNNYAMQLQEEGVVKNRQMIDKIEQFLETYNKDKGYDYIFSYSFGGNLLYGNDALDITDEVIKGINKAYPPEEE